MQAVRPHCAAHHVEWHHCSCGGTESLSLTGDPEQEREDFLLAADQRAEDSSSKHKFLIKLLNKSTLFLANVSF